MNLRRTRAVARKEFLHIVRDPRSLGMALAVPLLMLLLFGYALTLDVDRIATLVYDADQSPASRELIERFRGSRYFQILGFVDEYRTIEKKIDQSQCLLGLVIPRDYSRNLLAGKDAEVQLLLDGSDSNTAAIALGYAQGLLQTYALQLRADAFNRKGGGQVKPPAEARLRVWYNTELKSKNYIVPGLIAVILMIIAALLTSLTIAREWEMGTMEQLLSTPVRPTELVLGKMVAFFGVGLIDMVVAIGAGVLIFQVPLRGNPLLLFFTGGVFLFGALCWGILLSAIARQQLMAFQMGILSSFLPAFLLSGFIFAIENMPTVIQVITHIVSARYFVTLLKGIFLKGIGLEILWVEITFLLAYAGIVFLLATRKLKQKLA
jgi:ABC-2 type transport system permease protein